MRTVVFEVLGVGDRRLKVPMHGNWTLCVDDCKCDDDSETENKRLL